MASKPSAPACDAEPLLMWDRQGRNCHFCQRPRSNVFFDVRNSQALGVEFPGRSANRRYCGRSVFDSSAKTGWTPFSGFKNPVLKTSRVEKEFSRISCNRLKLCRSQVPRRAEEIPQALGSWLSCLLRTIRNAHHPRFAFSGGLRYVDWQLCSLNVLKDHAVRFLNA